MGWEESPPAGAYVRLLAEEARRLQHDARVALDRGEYTRASALIADAEMLAEDVHGLVGEIEHREIGALANLADYDVRALASPAPAQSWPQLAQPLRRLRLAIGASLLIGLALAEY